MNSLHTTNTNINNMVKGDLMSPEKIIELLTHNYLSFSGTKMYIL